MSDPAKPRLGIREVIGEKRDAILRLAEQYNAYDVRVFGSVARSEGRPDSDVDFLVQFRENASLWDKVGFWQSLTELMGRSVDISTDKTLRDHVKSTALRDAVKL